MPLEITTAFLCPGQGAQSPAMEELIVGSPATANLLDLASDLLKEDLRKLEGRDVAFFNRNEISAILVSLASIAANERLVSILPPPEFYAGYSVGQWTAMHLAGMLPAESLIKVLINRARLMNNTRAVREGTMLAVIGLPREQVEKVTVDIEGYLIIANDNAPGQFTLAGEYAAIDAAEQRLAALKPQRLSRVPVAGAWHSSMVDEARAPFEGYLANIPLAAPRVPVISNVTGLPLPQDIKLLRAELVAHLSSPVRWADSIRYLIHQGTFRFVEIGYEQTLSKFGFFIDRSRQHLPWYKLITV